VKEKKVTWLELFFDLVFVVAISSTNHWLSHFNQEPNHLLEIITKYILMIIPLWWCWIGQTMFYNRFSHYLKYPFLFMFAQVFFIIIMSASFNLDFNATYLSFIIGYIGSRLITIIQYSLIKYKECSNHIVSVALCLRNGMFFGIIITISSLFAPNEWRYILMYSGIIIDIIMPLLHHNKLKKVPVNLAHLAERLGLLVMITFGEAIVSIVELLEENTFNIHHLTYYLIVFICLATMWISYFNKIDNLIDKEKKSTGQLLLYLHLIIIIAIMLFSAIINLYFDSNLSNGQLTFLLILSYLSFFISKEIIFTYHAHTSYQFKLNWFILIIIAIITITIILIILQLSLIYSLFLISIIAVIDYKVLNI
jgi:low temperature requirement protein LtrA